MENFTTVSLFILFSVLCNITVIPALNPICGEWLPYKDEKCIKIFNDTTNTYEESEKFCSQYENGGSLVTIHSAEEQAFIETYIFVTNKIANDVWIGLKYNQTQFKWADNSILSFTNWLSGTPQITSGKNCVQMSSDSPGKWITEPCERKNVYVCQKSQSWSLSYLQTLVISQRKQIEEVKVENNQLKISLENVTTELSAQQMALNELKHNPIPIGFIYVQFANQSEPKSIWPEIEWLDVSNDYAGLFFRAIGANSAEFNTVQEQSYPALSVLTRCCWEHDDLGPLAGSIDVPTNGDQSHYVLLGSDTGKFHIYSSFKYSAAQEVRPRNQAIRVWKRIK